MIFIATRCAQAAREVEGESSAVFSLPCDRGDHVLTGSAAMTCVNLPPGYSTC
jgi:hypothetical protein